MATERVDIEVYQARFGEILWLIEMTVVEESFCGKEEIKLKRNDRNYIKSIIVQFSHG